MCCSGFNSGFGRGNLDTDSSFGYFLCIAETPRPLFLSPVFLEYPRAEEVENDAVDGSAVPSDLFGHCLDAARRQVVFRQRSDIVDILPALQNLHTKIRYIHNSFMSLGN